MLPLLCSISLISPNLDVKLIIFSNFGQGPFPKITGKSPDVLCCIFLANLRGKCSKLTALVSGLTDLSLTADWQS